MKTPTMLKTATVALLTVLFFVNSTFAADLTGRWTGRIMDQFDVAYDFVQEGEKLSGFTMGPDGNKIEIKDGSVKGDEVLFTINVMDTDMKIKGKVEDGILKLSFDFQGQVMSFELKKT
jgi:hypothetical protein